MYTEQVSNFRKYVQISQSHVNLRKMHIGVRVFETASRQYLSARVKILSPYDKSLVYLPMRKVDQKISHKAQIPSVLLREMPSVVHEPIKN